MAKFRDYLCRLDRELHYYIMANYVSGSDPLPPQSGHLIKLSDGA